jgi:hypothetical protein
VAAIFPAEAGGKLDSSAQAPQLTCDGGRRMRRALPRVSHMLLARDRASLRRARCGPAPGGENVRGGKRLPFHLLPINDYEQSRRTWSCAGPQRTHCTRRAEGLQKPHDSDRRPPPTAPPAAARRPFPTAGNAQAPGTPPPRRDGWPPSGLSQAAGARMARRRLAPAGRPRRRRWRRRPPERRRRGRGRAAGRPRRCRRARAPRAARIGGVPRAVAMERGRVGVELKQGERVRAWGARGAAPRPRRAAIPSPTPPIPGATPTLSWPSNSSAFGRAPTPTTTSAAGSGAPSFSCTLATWADGGGAIVSPKLCAGGAGRRLSRAGQGKGRRIQRAQEAPAAPALERACPSRPSLRRRTRPSAPAVQPVATVPLMMVMPFAA